MSYDPYDAPRERSHRYAYDDRRDSRYADPRDDYLRVYPESHELVRRREDSDLSIEEVHRDFPPPNSRDVRRTRSAEPGYYYDDDRDRDRDRDQRLVRSRHDDERSKTSKRHVLTRQEKLMVALAGAALAIGGKELYDRREAKEGRHQVERNYIQSGALAAAGALAGYGGAAVYNKQWAEKGDPESTYVIHRGRDGRLVEYYSDDEEDPTVKKGHKSFLESMLGAGSLGAALKAFSGDDKESKADRDRDRDGRTRSSVGGSTRGRSGSNSSTRSRGGNRSKVQQAAIASLMAGAAEAFRIAREPGGWKGEKMKRMATAAISAGAIDTAQSSDKSTKLSLAESVIGGLLSSRIVNGSKKNIEADEKTGRSRSRSRARSLGGSGSGASKIAALAGGGLAAVLGKKAWDNRSRSPDSDRGRDRDDSPPRHRSRSRSVVDAARKGLARIGFGNDPDDRDKDRDGRSRRHSDEYDDERGSSRRHHRRNDYDDEDYDYNHGSSRGGGDRDDYYPEDDRAYRSSRRKGASTRHLDSASDLGDSDDDDRRARRTRDGARRN